MRVQCIQCRHFELRGAGAMARVGFGRCKAQPTIATFDSATFERHCPKFSQADNAVVRKRQAWLADQRKQFIKEILS